MTFPAYPEYKDSGVEWLGEVPSHWGVRRLKHVATVFPSNIDKKAYDDEEPVRLCNYVDVYYHEVILKDLPFMDATATPEQISKFRLRADDTIITKDSESADDIAIAAYVPQDLPGVVCGYHLSMVRPREGAQGRFIKRLFDSRFVKAQFEVAARGLTRVGLSQYAVDNVLVTVPPEAEQSAIAAFLDRETGKIDALVAEQEKLIELLKEKRQAVISHAVTKGLDPNVPMRDSGVKWLGEVPEHWEVVRLKTVLEAIQQGWSPEAIDRLAEDGEWGVLKAGCVNHGRFRDTEHKALPEGVEPPQDIDVQPGDVLMSRASGSLDLIGSVALVETCGYKLIMSDKVFRLKPLSERVRAEFLALLMGARSVRAQVRLAVSGAGGLANNIGKGSIREMWIALPPVSEQAEITSFVGGQCHRLDQLAGEAQRAIDLLKERRAALISAAVTGKIDVRADEPQTSRGREAVSA